MFRKLDREKSFDEARTAVQNQIEKIFQKANSKLQANAGNLDHGDGGGGPLQRRYKMHGVSHVNLDDSLSSRSIPPPTHGIKYSISNHPLALAARWQMGETPPESVYNHSPPVISRHDSIESLNMRHNQDDSLHRFKYSLANERLDLIIG